MDPEISEILPSLYLGGLASLKYLEAFTITHVLSVVNFPIQKDLSGYVTLQLPLQDSEGANMLQYLPAAIKFLDATLGGSPGAQQSSPLAAAGPAPAASGGDGSEARAPAEPQPGADAGCTKAVARVLVHCQAGVSRSAAVVAGWLMRSRGMSAEEALAFLRSRRRAVDPNEGFRSQLMLFADMRCSLDASHPVYRMWCLEELASQWEDRGYVDPLVFGQLPDGPAGLSAAVAALQSLYRCRKCRQLLATSAHVVPVEAAMGHRTFRHTQRRHHTLTADSSGDGAAESCLFVEPMQWMAETITGVVAGKLHCPKCYARLGSFNWSGISNPSGAWVTPAFQLHASKLDTVLPKPLEALANVRQPLLGPARAAAAAPSAAASAASAAPTAAAVAQATLPLPAAPSLPATLPAAVRRMGLGKSGTEEDDVDQLPEPQLILDPDAPANPQPPTVSSSSSASASASAVADAAVLAAAAAASTAQGGNTSATATEGPGTDCGDGSSARAGCVAAWFTHLILDCDGVMVDSEESSCEALRRAILEVTGFDIPHTFPRDYIEVFGMDVRSCVAHYRERFGLSHWEAAEVLAPRVQAAKEVHYKELTQGGIPAFDGAERLIRRALDAGMQVGLASSGTPDKIARNLTSSGLAPLVPAHAIVSAAHVPAGKPAPDVYLAAMKATGCCEPHRALVVEDAVNGLKAARAAGMFTVGITNQLPAALLAPWADIVVSHLDEIDPAGLVPAAAAADKAAETV